MIRKLFAILLLSSPAMASFNGWTYQRMITLSTTTGVTSNLSNFPVEISTNVPSISTTTAYGHMTSAYDQGFFSDSNCQFALNWDTETVNNTGTNSTQIWVQVPTINQGSLGTLAATFYWCYGNSGITSYVGHSTGVWDSNYIAVYHLPNGSTLSAQDSTVNGFNGTPTNTPTATAGQIDGAANFVSGSSQYIDNGSAINTPFSNTPFTISFWLNTPSAATSQSILGNADGNDGAMVKILNSGGNKIQAIVQSTIGGGNTSRLGSVVMSANTWYYAYFSYDNITSLTVGINTTFNTNGAGAAGANFGVSTFDFAIGAVLQSSTFFNGIIDEMRMSKIVRTQDWTTTEYNNQNNPGGFVTVGVETGGSAPISPSQNLGLLIQGGKLQIKGGKVIIL